MVDIEFKRKILEMKDLEWISTKVCMLFSSDWMRWEHIGGYLRKRLSL